MRFLSWLRSGPRHKSSGQRPAWRPTLEALEDRWLPSTLTVTGPADSGAGSLRADIAAANSGDTIVFDPSLNGQTIKLTGGELLINKNLTIQGPGASQLTISGNNTHRVFEIDSAVATIAGLTISNGDAAAPFYYGGGIYNLKGNLTVSDCTLSNNRANAGGGIYNAFGSTLTVSGCTLSGNHFTAKEGQMGGAGIWNYGTATVTTSTISGNSGPVFIGQSLGDGSSGDGGGIYNRGRMTLQGSTVTNNSPYQHGGGIFNDQGATLSILSKSVVSGNKIGDLFLALGSGPVTISSDSAVGQISRG
jgi:hypothetical protein